MVTKITQGLTQGEAAREMITTGEEGQHHCDTEERCYLAK